MTATTLTSLPAAIGCTRCHDLWVELCETRRQLAAERKRAEALESVLTAAVMDRARTEQRPLAAVISELFRAGQVAAATTKRTATV